MDQQRIMGPWREYKVYRLRIFGFGEKEEDQRLPGGAQLRKKEKRWSGKSWNEVPYVPWGMEQRGNREQQNRLVTEHALPDTTSSDAKSLIRQKQGPCRSHI